MAAKGGKKTAGSAGRRVTAARARGEAKVGRTIDAAAEKLEGQREPRGRGRRPGLTSAQKAVRDTAIVARKAQGWTDKRVAESFDVSERTVRDVTRAARSVPSGMEVTPMQLVEDLMRQYRAMVGDLEQLSFEYAGSHPGAALTAKRQARDVLVDLVALQRMLGLLPSNLGLFRAEADLRRLGEVVLEHLAEFERGNLTAEQVAEYVRDDVIQQAMGELPAE